MTRGFTRFARFLTRTPGPDGHRRGPVKLLVEPLEVRAVPALSIADVTVAEGAAGASTPVALVATLDQPAASDLVLSATTSGGTATADTDYAGGTADVIIPAGQTSVSFSPFTVLGDNVAESDETFQVTLTGPDGTPATATVTIQNDDDDTGGTPGGPSTIQFASAAFSGPEGSSADITLTRTGDLSAGATVVVTPVPATIVRAVAGPGDFANVPVTASFGPGQATATVAINLLQDTQIEGTETFRVNLTNPSPPNTVGGTTTATVSILDDDSGPGPGPGPVPVPVGTTAFITGVYQNLLGRAPEPAAMSFWGNFLQSNPSAQGRFQFTSAVVVSDEFRAIQINDVYQDFFNRPADAGGLTNALAFLRAGGSMDQLKAALASSDEYFALAGGNAQGYLQALYSDLLNGGAPLIFRQDVSGAAARFDIALRIAQGLTADGRTVADYYNQVLHISPDPAGVSFWSNLLIGLDDFGRPRGILTEDQLVAALATFITPG